MFDLYMRHYKDLIYEQLLQKLFNLFLENRITPNFITLIGFIIGLLSSFFIYIQYIKIGLILWLLNRFLDGLDGSNYLNRHIREKN